MSSGQQRTIWRRRVLRLVAHSLGPNPRPPDQIRRIAVFRPDHLGDLVLALPAIARLREALPVAELTLFVGPWSTPLARLVPGVRVRVLPFPGFQRGPKGAPWSPYLMLAGEARRLNKERYDLAIVLRFDHWWGAWLARWAGIPTRVGFDQPDALPFLSDPVRYQPGRHESLQNQSLVDRVIRLAGATPPGFDVGRPRLAVPVEPLPAGLIRPFAVLHPGSGALVKRWTNEAYRTVAEHLAIEHGLTIAITGAGAERVLVDDVAAGLGRPSVRLIDLPLERLASVLGQAAIVIGPDSGVLHLASAVGTPTVRLYGPVDHRTFGPWADDRSQLVLSTLPCVPCNRLDYRVNELPAHPCIREIPPNQVIAATRRALQSTVPA